MSASQFDDLLGDFGDSTTTTTTTTTTKSSSNGGMDDFDPFGPPSGDGHTNGGDSGMLLDFSAGAEVKNGDSSNNGGLGLDFDFNNTTTTTSTTASSGSANPLYDMSSDDTQQSSNPLYDLGDDSSNPLYDMSNQDEAQDANQSANPLYDLNSAPETGGSSSQQQPSNPLYDFEDQFTTEENAEEEDLMSGTMEQQQQQYHQQQMMMGDDNNDDGDFMPQDQNQSSGGQADLLGGFDASPQGEGQNEEEEEGEEEYKPVIMNGDPAHWVSQEPEPEPEPEPQQEEEEEEEAEEEQGQQSYSERVEIVEEEEEVIQDGRTVTKTTRTENRYSDSGVESKQTTSQWSKDSSKDANRQAQEQEAQFTGMSSVKTKFESQPKPTERKQVDIKQEVMDSEGGEYENQPQSYQQWQNEEEEEEGVYENQPQHRDDVAREADRDLTKDLPAVGTASSIRAKFLAQQEEKNQQRPKREITPPPHGSGGEYTSEPRSTIEKYEGKAESGVFESQPQSNPDVITSSTTAEDARPEQGYTRNVASKFKELESQKGTYKPSPRKELTPDRSGQVEYTSEPRTQSQVYESKVDAGVFESQPQINPDVVRAEEHLEEQLPERGYAKNLANKFRQISENQTSPPSAGNRAKREITPDSSGRTEYVSEPRGQTQTYETKVDAGVFENAPQRNADVVTSDTQTEEYIPEKGYTRNVAAKFRELESTAKSPPISPGRRKEFTPPREEERIHSSGVLENNPEVNTEVVHSGDQVQEALPERGTAKNMAQRFKQMASENSSNTSPRAKKEFTPPPSGSGGVYENQPKQFQADYNRPAESGILENNPEQRSDVVRSDNTRYTEEELPERGSARNMVSKWKQMESESAKAKSPASGRPKEFTPPRDEPRIAEQRKSPRTPMSPAGQDQLDNGSVHPSELPGQYQPQNEASVFESTPENQREDVVRSGETDWTEGMPKKDTAKKMLARFQQLQSQANQQSSPPERKAKNIRNQ